MKKLSAKAILSTLLILIFLTLVTTGTLLYFGRTGVVFGFTRFMLREVHFWIAISLCVLTPVHLILNLRLYRTELRSLRGKKAAGENELTEEENQSREKEQ